MKQSSVLLLLAILLAVFVAPGRTSAAITPLARITLMSAGEGGFALALRHDGALLSWGANAAGTLGNGTTDPNLLPSAVIGLGTGSDVVAVASSAVFALALKADGTVLGWGANALGQLGDTTFTNRLTPVTSVTLGSGSGVVAIAAGLSHAVALKADGSVWSWGSNNNGNLGNPSIVGASNVPVPVVGLGSGSGVVALTAGGNFTLALKADGTVWAWGNNNNGQLGIGNTTNQPVPVQVKGSGAVGVLSNIVALSAPPASNGVFALALSADGTLWAWGNNSTGQLGDGTTSNRTTPVQVKDVGGSGVLSGVIAIDAGGGTNNLHALAVQTDGTVLA
jgi:alpha-tubulin suppressor-like RCC1 family protein